MIGLSQKTEQKQSLSEKQIESLKILQLTSDELEQYINDYALSNPIVDIINNNQCDYYDFYTEEESTEDEENYTDKVIRNITTDNIKELREYLWDQLITKKYDERETIIIEYIINSLDEDGYFRESLQITAARFGVSEGVVKKLLCDIQKCEPLGIAARDLKECLKIQLYKNNLLDPIMKSLIEDHLKDIALNRLPQIAKSLSLSLSELKEYCSKIKKLNPAPGNGFGGGGQTPYISPDVIITNNNGSFEVRTSNQYEKLIRINRSYVQLFRETSDAETLKYLEGKFKSASWLKSCIEKREETLIRITTVILSKQKSFFKNEKQGLNPLTLKDIADELDISESTVSRGIKNKYLKCSKGLFQFSDFLCSGRKNTNDSNEDGETSVDIVKKFIRTIVDTEDRKKPYSDQTLTEMLKSEGFDIPRRTVAQYRKDMNILNKSQRKEY